MLPFFAMSSAAEPADVPPPSSFRPIHGQIRRARLAMPARYSRVRGTTAVREAGLRYEAQVQAMLQEELGEPYSPSPTIFFLDDSGARRFIPDGLYFDPGGIWCAIVEVKAQHTPNMWHQTQQYERVLRCVPECDTLVIKHLEVVKSFDPATPFPIKVHCVDSVKKWLAEPPAFGVMRWRKS